MGEKSYNVKIIEFNGVSQVRRYKSTVRVLSDDEKAALREKRDTATYVDFWQHCVLNPFSGKLEYLDDIPVNDPVALAFSRQRSLTSSFNRTKQNFYNLVRANEWEYFGTLTFNRTVVDSSDFSELTRHMNSFLTYARRLAPSLKYVLVPELHSDGVHYHLHGLFSNMGKLKLVDSGHVINDKVIYNLADFKKGFTNFSKIDDLRRTCSYICKYVTKDMCSLSKGKRRYWSSRNLNKPAISTYMLYPDEFDTFIDSVGEVEYAKSIDVSSVDPLSKTEHLYNHCAIFEVETK